MRFLPVLALVVGVTLVAVGCSKEEPEGTAEKMGKKVDEAAETARQEVTEAVEATQEQAAEAKAQLGTAMKDKGEEMQKEAETSKE